MIVSADARGRRTSAQVSPMMAPTVQPGTKRSDTRLWANAAGMVRLETESSNVKLNEKTSAVAVSGMITGTAAFAIGWSREQTTMSAR